MLGSKSHSPNYKITDKLITDLANYRPADGPTDLKKRTNPPSYPLIGLYRILIWPDTGYPEAGLAKNKLYFNVKKIRRFFFLIFPLFFLPILFFFFQFSQFFR